MLAIVVCSQQVAWGVPWNVPADQWQRFDVKRDGDLVGDHVRMYLYSQVYTLAHAHMCFYASIIPGDNCLHICMYYISTKLEISYNKFI